MTAGGFKPTRTPAKVLINAARMSEVLVDHPLEGDRTRQRSESTTSPGPSLLRAGIEAHKAGQAGDSKGKRVKVSGEV